MPDFYLSVLVAAGFDIHMALVTTGSILLTSLSGLIYALNARVTGSTAAGMLAVWLAILSGGLGGFVYAQQEPNWWTWANLTSNKFIHGPDHVLYWAGGRSGYWFALTPHILFPQRTVQHAYPLALSVLLLAWEGLAGRPTVHKALVVAAPAGGAAAGSSSAAAATAAASGTSARREAIQTVRKRASKAGGGASTGAGSAAGRDGSSSESGESSGGSAAVATYADSPAWYTRAGQLRLFAVCGFVAGLLPLMQPHSFVSVGVITLVMALCQGLWLLAAALVPPAAAAPKAGSAAALAEGAAATAAADDTKPPTDAAAAGSLSAVAPAPGGGWVALLDAVLQWGTYGAVAAALALPQMVKHLFHRVSFGSGGHSGFIRLNPVWAEEGKGLGPVQTWWNALGLFLPTYALGLLLLRTREQLAVYAGFVALFVVANYVMFQPWHMDNTKARCVRSRRRARANSPRV